MADTEAQQARSPRGLPAGTATWLSVLLALAVLVDNTSYALLGPQHVKGADFVFVGLAGVFLIACAVFRRTAGKISLSFLAVLVTMLLAEVVVSIAAPTHGRAFSWYVWPPNHSIMLQPQNLTGVSKKGRFTTNSRGIRGPEFSEDDRFRILCLGGSTTECLYLDDEKAWPEVLAKMLSDGRAGRVWVGNVGRGGRTALDHATLLSHLPEARMCHLWVVLCGVNTFGQRLRGKYDENAAHTWEKTFVYRRPGFRRPLCRPYHRNLFLYRLLEDLRIRVKMAGKSKDGQVYQDVRASWIDDRRKLRKAGRGSQPLPGLSAFLADYEANLMRMIELARRSGKVIVFATQPVMWSDQMTDEQKALCIGTQSPEGRYYAFGPLARGMEMFNDRMRAVCKREGIWCVDLAGMLPKSSQVLYDDCHFNENGARLVAGHLAAVIAPMIE